MRAQIALGLVAGVLLLFANAPAVARDEGPAAELVAIDPDLGTTLVVWKRIVAHEVRGGLAKLLPSSGALVIDPGHYHPQFGLKSKDRRWVLVPYKLLLDGIERSPETSMTIGGSCASRFSRYLALDTATLQFEPRIWRSQFHRCTNGMAETTLDGEWTHTVQLRRAGEFTLGSPDEIVAAERARRDRLVLDAIHRDSEIAAAKRTVGARLCRSSLGWDLVGVTQDFRQKDGKLKVRIVEKSRPGQANLKVGDIAQPESWEYPEAWTLCP